MYRFTRIHLNCLAKRDKVVLGNGMACVMDDTKQNREYKVKPHSYFYSIRNRVGSNIYKFKYSYW